MASDLIVVPYSEFVEPVAPEVSGVTPTSGSNISPSASIQFDVTVSDDSGVPFVMVWADYRDRQLTEVVYNGAEFDANFSGTKTPISGGFRFVFTRLGGFAAQPDIKVAAVSGSGGVL